MGSLLGHPSGRRNVSPRYLTALLLLTSSSDLAGTMINVMSRSVTGDIMSAMSAMSARL